MKEKDLIRFMDRMIEERKAEYALGTAHIYQASRNALSAFLKAHDIPFKRVRPELLKQFERFLRRRGNSWNTVSTHMRVLRAVYNRAVDRRLAPHVPHLFKAVYTGTQADIKRALKAEEMWQLLDTKCTRKQSELLQKTHHLFVLMFLLRGLPFVDLAYIQKKDLNGNILTYHRRKTGRQITITVTKDAMNIIREYMDTTTESPYLFPILSAEGGEDTIYREYQQALRIFNYQLTKLGELLGLTTELTSYTARHTWATLAYYLEVHPGIIREAMGHSSIKVTETYLKPFNIKKLDETNLSIIGYAKRSFEG